MVPACIGPRDNLSSEKTGIIDTRIAEMIPQGFNGRIPGKVFLYNEHASET